MNSVLPGLAPSPSLALARSLPGDSHLCSFPEPLDGPRESRRVFIFSRAWCWEPGLSGVKCFSVLLVFTFKVTPRTRGRGEEFVTAAWRSVLMGPGVQSMSVLCFYGTI